MRSASVIDWSLWGIFPLRAPQYRGPGSLCWLWLHRVAIGRSFLAPASFELASGSHAVREVSYLDDKDLRILQLSRQSHFIEGIALTTAMHAS